MKHSVIVLFLMLFPLSAHSVCIKNEPNWLWNYDGTLGGRYQVRMTLVFAGEEVSGLYFYSSQLKDIPLKGSVIDGTNILLDEFDGAGNVVAHFEGKFPERDPRGRFGNSKLGCEVIVGSWHKVNSPESLPVYLSLESGTAGSLTNRYAPAGADDDNMIHRRVYRFWNAVRLGDKKTVAAAIAYPIRVHLPTGRKRLSNPTELIANYDDIFSPKYREAIANALPRNMFVRDQGIMLGSGEVWFGPDGKVITLNHF
ncbi:MAG: hypothetical protein EG825_12900 [Rhodocyclaceae bacterium]|nr:hypothetical protein [Rhodocyclaceae bacterium]